MIVQVNDFALNDPDNRVYLDEPIEGLELPPLRTSSGNYSGRDGGYVGRQLYSPRSISLQGRIFSSDVATLEDRRTELQAALAVKDVELKVTTNAGRAFIVYCKLLDFKAPIVRQNFSAPYKIELLASDPIIYDDTTGAELTATVPKKAGGGYEYPVIYPVEYGAGSGAVAVTNNGETAVAPVIEIEGGCTDPVITNVTTGQFLGLDLVTVPGDVITIDMRQRTVLLNGGNILGLLTDSSEFWELQPGANSIELTSSEVTDDIEATVSWRNGYLGV